MECNEDHIKLNKKEVLQFPSGIFLQEYISKNNMPFNISYFSVPCGESTPVDEHDSLECWVITSGHGEILYDDIKYEAHKNDIFRFESNKPHQITNNSNELMIVLSIWWSNENKTL